MRTLPGDSWHPGDELADVAERWPVQASEQRYDDGFVSVRVDTLTARDGASFERSIVEHKGAVGVLALDREDRVLLLRQYRHAAGQRLLEIPAGICDVPDELPEQTAARELREEAGLAATDWRLLLEIAPTPGSSTEKWQVFLARDLTPAVSPGDPEREHEEADMSAVWVPLGAAVTAVLDRRLSDAMAGLAVLALAQLRPLQPASQCGH